MSRLDLPENQDLRLNATGRNYYIWLLTKINYRNHPDHNDLLDILFNREFQYVIENDENRAQEGLMLREEYEEETDWPISEYKEVGLNVPCSVLEMLVGLAKTIEDRIMYDPDFGDRTETWFWEMVRNLGLEKCTDEEIFLNGRFGEPFVDGVIEKWMARDFEIDGIGSPFPLKNPDRNQRNQEIWFQAMDYLNENYAV